MNTTRFHLYEISVLSHFSCALLFVTLWTVACQAPQSMGFFKQEYQSGFPCSPSGVFLTQGLNSCLLHVSSALQADSLPLSHQGTPLL